MTFSATQVTTYELCPRKWAWRYVEKLPAETSRWMSFGLKVHEYVAAHLTGTKADASLDEQACAKKLLPFLGTGLVEHKMLFDLGGHAFVGYIDILNAEASPPVVYDHKTTSDLRWIKSAEELVDDVQATLYAYAVMGELDVEIVRLQWTYVTTRGVPVAVPVSRVVTLAEIMPRLTKTVETAEEMQLIHETGLSALEVHYNGSACEMYGGCPYKNKCNLTPEEQLESVMSARDSLMARINARRNAPAVEAPKQDVINPPPAPVAEEAPPEIGPNLAPVAETVSEAVPVVEPPKPRRGRPAKTETPAEPTPAANGGFTLYVDCYPVKGGGQVEEAADRIEHVLQAFRTATGAAHYKLVPYGEGVGHFLGGMTKDLAERPPKGAVHLSTSSLEGKDALQSFMAAASVVVSS